MRIQEIAEKAGVSTATVSRVFSHYPNIRKEVREHVFAVARECGYHPRLSTKQRNVVVITPYKLVYPVQAYVEMVMTELTRELSMRGCRIEILPHDNLERLDSLNRNYEQLEADANEKFVPDERYPDLSRDEMVKHNLLAIVL